MVATSHKHNKKTHVILFYQLHTNIQWSKWNSKCDADETYKEYERINVIRLLGKKWLWLISIQKENQTEIQGQVTCLNHRQIIESSMWNIYFNENSCISTWLNRLRNHSRNIWKYFYDFTDPRDCLLLNYIINLKETICNNFMLATHKYNPTVLFFFLFDKY